MLPENIIAYKHGKSPTEAVTYLKDIISVAKANNTNCTLLIADLEAAYDKIYKNYIIFLLERMNFPQAFNKILKTLIYNNKVLITINNTQEGIIELKAGVAQGCTLSVSVFNIGTIPLDLATKSTPSIMINLKKASFKENKEIILKNLPPILFADDF